MEKLTSLQARALSPLTLAFLGDGVYEALVRQRIVLDKGSMPAAKLHAAAVGKVRATYQSDAVALIEPVLTEEEANILRRGRNAGSTVPKTASPEEYHRATGLEALFGYLALIGENQRTEELFAIVYEGKVPLP